VKWNYFEIILKLLHCFIYWNYFEIILKLLHRFISHVATFEIEIQLFQLH